MNRGDNCNKYNRGFIALNRDAIFRAIKHELSMNTYPAYIKDGGNIVWYLIMGTGYENEPKHEYTERILSGIANDIISRIIKNIDSQEVNPGNSHDIRRIICETERTDSDKREQENS